MKSIEVKSLKKKYRIYGVQKDRYDTLRDSLAHNTRKIFSAMSRVSFAPSSKMHDFWALKGISFEVETGERIGLIGPNGAGKTTVLKILSRITSPTEGRAYLRGRVAALLEVGTGFHPELTGRENIFLNGSILGMRRKEIVKRFEQIVDFSGIEQFIDTPVKRYSSGMFVRLAFSVAAHLESEILLVDEVLAVGDIQFQEKCISKMKDISGEQDRTILFVTHNMAALRKFCDKAILIENGEIRFSGPVDKAVEKYIVANKDISEKIFWEKNERPGNSEIKIIEIEIVDRSNDNSKTVSISENFFIRIVYEITSKKAKPQFSIVLSDNEGNCVFGSINNTDSGHYGKHMEKGIYRASCEVYGDLLNSGLYYVTLIGFSGNFSDQFRIDNIISFEAIDDGILKKDYSGEYGGCVRPRLIWTTEKMNECN